MMKLLAWARAVYAGEEEALLWQALFETGADFSPLVYVLKAFELHGDLQRGLALAFASAVDGRLEPVSYPLVDMAVSQRQLRESLCFDDQALMEGILRPHGRLLSFVLEEDYVTALPGCTLWQGGDLPTSEMLHQRAQQMEGFLKATEQAVTFRLWGEPGAGRRTLAKTLAKQLDSPLLLVEIEAFSQWTDYDLHTALVRECKLMGCPVCVSGTGRFVDGLLKDLALQTGYSLLCAQEPGAQERVDAQWRTLDVAVPLPTVRESHQLWRDILAQQGAAVDVHHCASLYRLTPGQICKAVEWAENHGRWQGKEYLDTQALVLGCRSQLRHSLGDKARRIEPVFSWDELVLPERSKTLLQAACVRMQNRNRVMDTWGFGEKLPYGAGLSMLFSGPPGTGKTMGAQVVARELGLELYKVDLATIVSKYVGETEKNLSVIFHEANRSGAVLFFDEADALFGKRTEVKDAHDRYNNMEAAYLLQKIEEYDGVSVLATNYLQNIDDAFRRRLSYIIEFPFPDKAQRLKLWTGVFPQSTPVDAEMDWDFLATAFELSGSGIKSCALSAAYLAAGAGCQVSMAQVLLAVRRELEKSGKSVSKEEFGPYYMLLE